MSSSVAMATVVRSCPTTGRAIARRGMSSPRPCSKAAYCRASFSQSARQVPVGEGARTHSLKMRAVSREEDPDLEAFKNALTDAEGGAEGVEAAEAEDPDVLTGEELVELIREKWGARYDCRISRQRDGVNNLRFYLQIMWKFLEQKSFPLSEEEYYEQLDAVASLVTEWGLADHVRNEIKTSKKNPVIGHTIGGGAKCVSIPLLDADQV